MPIRSKRVTQRGTKVSRKRNRRTKRGKVVIRSRKGGANNNSVSVSKQQLQALDDMITQHAEEMKVVGLLGASRIINNLLSQDEPEPASPELSVNENVNMVTPEPSINSNRNVNMMSPEPSVNENLNENMGSPEPSVNENVNENENSEELNTPSEELNTPEQKSNNMTLADVTPESDESSAENGETPESQGESQVGGYYKRFIKSKKNNKKSVML